jgi:choline dehydrogenase-like flavoprotein
MVDEITFTKSKIGALTATGVKYTPKSTGKQVQAFAAKEVILATGGVFTPHLLMYSGLGPKDVLEAAGVTVKKVRHIGHYHRTHTDVLANRTFLPCDPTFKTTSQTT